MIFIVIPVHNRKELTRNCLSSLERQTLRDFKIIIVDDGSTDGTSQMIRDEFPDVHVLRGDGNLWWAGATNVGIEYVFQKLVYEDSDFILTLNNDLEVPEEYLANLLACAKKQKKAILGSISIDIDKSDYVSFCGVSWNEYTCKYHLKAKDYNNSFAELISKVQEIHTDMLPGRGTLIPVKVFSEIGLYDAKRFPQYAADDDFSLRAKRSGWDLIIPTRAYVKSHITETGVDVRAVKPNGKYLKDLFFSIKSPLNIKVRYRWAIKNTKLKIVYFFIDMTKIFISVTFRLIQRKA